MGFELNKLMRQYGLATPTMLSYEGERGPDVETVDEETGEITVTPGAVTFDQDKQRAFDQYQAQYQSRLQNAPMYAGSQFQTQTTPQPMSYMQMYQQYLGRDPTDQERTEAIGLDANITDATPLSLAQRQQFLRRYEDEFKDLGIRNTGNQAVMDTIGNYYGNILRNPDYRATPPNPSLPFSERYPNRPNPNPPYTGPVITTDDAYTDPVDAQGNVSQTFQDFANQQQQVLANIANPLTANISTIEEARNIDPFAPSSSAGVPAYGAYLAKNLDVFRNIMGRPEYQALPKGPGATPDQRAAVDDFVAQAAKDHFVNFGFGEGRKFYKSGGPVKGYQLGGQPIDPYAAVETVNVDTQIDPYGAVDPLYKTGLQMIIKDKNKGSTPPTEEIVEKSSTYTAPSTRDSEALENMIVEMMTKTGVNPYTGIMKNLSGQVSEAQTAYDQQLAEVLDNTRQGPDKAELWFNLAAALSAPTKTGTFGESLGLAAKELGKFSTESRKLRQSVEAAELKQAESKLKSLQSRYSKIQDKQSEEAIRNQEQQFKVIKWLQEFGIKKDDLRLKAANIQIKREQLKLDKLIKPQSKLGKEAEDEGFKPGTQAFFMRVREKAKLEAQQKNEMPSWQGKQLEEKVATGNVARYSIGQLKEALRLNGNAYAGDLFGMTMEGFKSLFGSDEKKLVNTRVLRNILSSEALQKLKATFGGQISDGERDALAELSGVTARSTDERRRIITNALKVLERLAHNTQKDIEWFGSPERFRAPYENYAQYQLENFRFADDDIRKRQQ